MLADSGEGYASERGARDAIDGIREYVGPADHPRPDPTAIEVYRDRVGEFRWRHVHKNGNILADGGQGYSRRHDAIRAVDRIRIQIDELNFQVYEDRRGGFRWRLRASNQEIVADSGEGYDDRDGAEAAFDRLREYAGDADVLDIGRAAFEVFEDEGGEHRWQLRHRNRNILADCCEGYPDRSGAWDAIASVKRNAPNAGMTD